MTTVAEPADRVVLARCRIAGCPWRFRGDTDQLCPWHKHDEAASIEVALMMAAPAGARGGR